MKTRNVSLDELVAILRKKRVLAGLVISFVLGLFLLTILFGDFLTQEVANMVFGLVITMIGCITASLVFMIIAVATSAPDTTEASIENRAMIAAIFGTIGGPVLFILFL